MKFKESETSFLYAATMLDDSVLVWMLPSYPEQAEVVSLDDFVQRFEESHC